MPMYESLHNHTAASDGTQTYAEVLETARRNKFGVVAFTDHDMLPGEKDLAALRDYAGPVKWLLGCEITSGLPRELGGGAASMFHILGLFTDPTNRALLDHCARALAARTERMERIVSNLKGLGFTISVDDCVRASGGESVGRPHIVRALNAHPENAAIIAGMKTEMAKAAVSSVEVAHKYMRMTQRDASDEPYALFLSDDSYLPGIYVDYLYSIDMDESVRLIREAGGVAILAHWPTIKRKINAGMLEGFLRDGRLDGVELRSGFVDSEVDGVARQLAAMAEQTGRLATIGVDGHREQDLERFANDRALAQSTVGQTARLVERVKPDLQWSNL